MKINKALKVILVDCVALLIGIINGFVLPKFLNIESYAYIKTFTLYIAYSGMFHLGFSDGIYILLGGKSLEKVSKEKLKGYFIVLLKILFLISIVLGIMSFLLIKDVIFKYFIIYTMLYQITLFISLLYRATGEFGRYSIVRTCINLFNLVSILIVAINKSPFTYMNIQILGYFCISIYYSMKILANNVKSEKVPLNDIFCLVKSGFLIMIAGTITNLFFSLDRWIVKINFSITEFAYYSFGVSMLNLFITLITSISVIFYPYLARNTDKTRINFRIKKWIIIITSFSPVGYFILVFIVENFIQNYKQSLDVLGILILSIPFIAIINILYSNLYKTEQKGKEYLVTAIIMLIINAILNIICLKFFNSSVSIAYATLISLIIWYLFSNKHFSQLNITKNEILNFIVYILSYRYINNLNENSLLKMILFIFIMMISITIFWGKDLKMFIKRQNLLS